MTRQRSIHRLVLRGYERSVERKLVAGQVDRDLRQEAEGVVVSVRWEGTEYQLRAPLYGLHQGGNVALAFTAAGRC